MLRGAPRFVHVASVTMLPKPGRRVIRYSTITLSASMMLMTGGPLSSAGNAISLPAIFVSTSASTRGYTTCDTLRAQAYQRGSYR